MVSSTLEIGSSTHKFVVSSSSSDRTVIMSIHGLILLLAVILQGYDAWKPTNTHPRTTTDVSRKVLTDVFKTVASLGIVGASTIAPARGSASNNRLTPEAFYQQFQYQKPSDILIYLDSLHLNDGDATGVLHGLETFASYYPMYALSNKKANILIDQLKQKQPKNALEIGSFFGYSALSMASSSPSTTKITCIEANPDNAAVARRVIEKGLGSQKDRVQFQEGISTTVLKSDVLSSIAPFDFVFLDHDKDTYIIDLKLLESRGWLTPSCTIVADNVVFPGAPGYLEYVMGPTTTTPSSEGGNVNVNVNSNDKYRTKLISTPFERIGFETQWKEVPDAMSVSERLQ